ncbi:retrotransposon ORF1 [Tanacetum coccineum]
MGMSISIDLFTTLVLTRRGVIQAIKGCDRVVYSLELNFWVVRIIIRRKTLENQYNLILESNSLEFQDTANSGQKKETKAMVFHQMDTEEVVKLCQEYEVKRGNKVVKKELIVALRGEIYFVKFIINPEEDDVEPGVIFGRSLLRMTKAITDFEAGTITIYPDFDPFLEDIEEEEKSLDDWDHLLNFNLDDIPLLGEEELPQFNIETSSSAGGHLTQEEAAKEALAIRISQKFALLEEVRLVIETMAYHDKYKKILDEIWKDKVELDGKIVKEEEEAVKRIKGESLKEKDDPRAFIFPIRLEGQVNENALANTGSDINTMPYRLYEQLGREDMKKVDRGITMINHTQAKAMGILTNVLCQVGVTTLIAKFLILEIPIDRDAPIIVGRGFLHTIGGITMGTHDDEAGSSRSKRSRQHEIVEEVLLPQVHHEFLLWEGCNKDAKSRMGCDGEIDDMLRIRLCEAESNKEIFTFVTWIRGFNINEPIYAELYHEFYLIYEFDKVCANDEFQTKKIIKFRLGGLRYDEHFNTQAYWLSISREENLSLSRNHTSTIRSPILRVIHKMITYGLCQRTSGKGAGTQKESKICCGQFISKIARKSRVLTDDVVRSLSAPIYCRDLDTTPLMDLIDSEGKLIPEDP